MIWDYPQDWNAPAGPLIYSAVTHGLILGTMAADSVPKQPSRRLALRLQGSFHRELRPPSPQKDAPSQKYEQIWTYSWSVTSLAVYLIGLVT